MTRKIILYAALLAIIVGGAPYLTGMLVETTFQDVITVLSEVDTMPATITLTEYNRGWLNSEAKTRVVVMLSKQGGPAKPYSVILAHDIRHGPLIRQKTDKESRWRFVRALIHSKLMLSDEAKKILLAETGESELLDFNSTFEIDGSVNIKIEGKPFKLKEHSSTERVAWKGIQGEWQLSKDLKRLQGQFLVPGFDIDWDGVHFLGQDLSYRTELNRSPEGLWPGKFITTVREIKIENPIDKFSFQMNEAICGGGMAVEGSMASFAGTLNIEKVLFNNKEYGPIVYANTLKNIESRIIKSLFDLNRKIKRGDQPIQSNFMQYVIALLPDLLKPRPVFTIEQMQIRTTQGDINGLLNFAIGGAQAYDINNFQQILQSITAKAKLSLPKGVLRDILSHQYQNAAQPETQSQPANPPSTDLERAQAVEQKVNQTIAKWIQEGTMVEKNQFYESELDIQKGQIKLNGHPIQFQSGQGFTLPTPPSSGAPNTKPNTPAPIPMSN